ncbi:MAG: hypothetical protein HKO59_04640 [Phycisphaerales bacterium]|nr:hypothetical protein [Phycisphaerales bacterium]
MPMLGIRGRSSRAAHRLVAACLTIAGLTTATHADDIFVPGDATTIQAAINLANPGDRILVTPGTYTEDLIIPATASDIEIASTAGPVGTTIVGIALTAAGADRFSSPNISILGSDIVIDGMTIRGPAATPGQFAGGIVVGGDRVTISGCIIEVTNADLPHALSYGVQTYPPGTNPTGGEIDDLVIRENTFTPLGAGVRGYIGVVVAAAPSDPTPAGTTMVESNTFDGEVHRGIVVERSRVTVRFNSVTTALTPGTDAGWQGIVAASGVGTTQDDLVIFKNVVGGMVAGAGFTDGIRLGSTGGQVMTAINCSGNVVDACDVAIRVEDASSGSADIGIDGNRLTNSVMHALAISAGSVAEVMHANQNTILGSGLSGISNEATGVIEAAFCRWGTDSGPFDPDGVDEADETTCFDPATMINADGTGDAVSDANVDYCPWITTANPCLLECPESPTIALDETCRGLVPDLTVLVSADCGAPTPTTITQSIAPGTVIVGAVGVNVIITARNDDESVMESCSVIVFFADELPPVFSLEPEGGSICAGADFTFTAAADDGCSETTLQWTKDGEDLPGETGDALTITGADGSDAGLYAVRVTDTSGNSATSVGAELLVGVGPDLTITADPPSLGCAGSVVTLTAEVSGGAGEVTYLWSTGETTPTIDVTEPDTYSVTVTDATGMCEASDSIVIEAGADDAAPVIDCPADTSVDCSASTDPADTGTAIATDDCDVDPGVSHSDEVTPGACAGDFTITRTWTAMDATGNTATCVQMITVTDTTPPAITPGVIDVCFATLDEAETAAIAATTAVDDCSTVGLDASSTQDGCAATITITATDGCGNADAVEYLAQIGETDVDISPPSNVTVNADAGGCDAFVSIPPLEFTSTCPVVSVTNDFNDTDDASGVYPQGQTIVIWRVTDACGEESLAVHTVTVQDRNEFTVSLELKAMTEPVITRCITFEFYECPDGEPLVVREPIMFTNGLALDVPLEIECGNYTCVTARDDLHTLRRTDDDQFGVTPIVGVQYVADFTDRSGDGGDDDGLLGGNFNDDEFIEVLDFAVFVIRFAQTVGQTTCATPGPHPDVSGDGTVFTEDFSFIQINFLERADDACCAALGALTTGRSAGGPTIETPVAALRDRGLGYLAAADLDEDGWIDWHDIEAFMDGARPAPRTIAELPGQWTDPDVWQNGLAPDAGTDVEVRTVLTIDGPGALARDVFVMEGATLVVDDATLTARTLDVAPGGRLRITGPDAVLTLEGLYLAPGAILEWESGVVQVAGGPFAPAGLDLLLGGAPAVAALHLDHDATAVVSGDTYLGPEPDERGVLEVRGSTFTTGRSLFVGLGGAGWMHVADGGVVSAGDSVFISRAGALTGAGIVEGGVRNLGWLAPEGDLSVIGTYRQGQVGEESITPGPAGTLAVTLDAATHDRLRVEGVAILGGTLRITLAPGFVPRVGMTFDVVHAWTTADAFDHLDLPALPAGMEWAVEYDGERVWVEVRASAETDALVR